MDLDRARKLIDGLWDDLKTQADVDLVDLGRYLGQ